jgi:hypothetical protein
VKRDCDFALYCERNLVEHFFCRIKHFRAIATRHEKDGAKLPGRIASGLRAGVAYWCGLNDSSLLKTFNFLLINHRQ